MAWQSIVSSPDVAKENKQQIVETEHLMKALLEQKNGLARRIFSKIGVDNTKVLEATEKFIQRQPKVIECLLRFEMCGFFFSVCEANENFVFEFRCMEMLLVRCWGVIWKVCFREQDSLRKI